MSNVMEGIRILEIAEHTFVPAGVRDPRRLGCGRDQDRARRSAATRCVDC